MATMSLDIIINAQNAGIASLDRSLKGLNQTGRRTGGIFKNIQNVLGAFLLYKGFVFLQTQIKDFVGEVVNLQHELGIVQTQLTETGRDFRGEIKDNIFGISKATGLSPAGLAKAEFEIVSANIAVADSFKILDLSAKAAVAGGLTEVETAFNAALTQVNAFGLSVEDFNEVFDKQFNLVKRGIFTYEQLAGVIGNVSVVFAAMGQDVDTSNAAIAAISQVFTGKQLEQGATGLANAVRRMTFQFEEFGKQGINIVDLNGEFRNLVDIIEDLDAALEGLTESERAARIKQLFPDIRQQRGISTLLGQSESFRQFTVEQKFSTGDLDEAFAIVEESLKTQAGQIKNSLMPAFDGIVTGLTSMLSAVNGVVDGAKTFKNWVDDSIPESKGGTAFKDAMSLFLNPSGVLTASTKFLQDPTPANMNAVLGELDPNFQDRRDARAGDASQMSPIEIGRQLFGNRQVRNAFASSLPGALEEQTKFDIGGSGFGIQLEDQFSGVELTLAKIIEEAVFAGFEPANIESALEVFANEGADAFLVALGLLSPVGGSATFLDKLDFPGAIDFSDTLFKASDALRMGLIDPMGFTADELEMLGETTREFNRLLKVKGIIEGIGSIGKFFNPEFDVDSLLRDVFDDMKLMGTSMEELFNDPRKLADMLSSLDFGDINVDQRTNNNIIVRVSGSGDAQGIAEAVRDAITESNNEDSRQRVGSRL